MTDLMAFGGPAGPCYAQKVAWQRPTSVLSVAAGTAKNTSTDQQAVYQSLSARDGYAWKQMAEKAKIDPASLGNLGIGGFSAFHGFANAFLKNPADFDRCCYVHLADACFLGAGATTPHAGYAAFAQQAAAGTGGKMMTATTNGPWGKSLSYSYDYGGGDVSTFNLTSGAQCFELVWNAAVGAGLSVTTPDIPPGMPQPTKAMRVGNLIWLHYETMTPGLAHPCGGEYTQHGWHVVALATPMMSYYGAPWMADVRPGLGNLLSDPATAAKTAVAVGVAGLVGYVLWKWLTRNRGYYPNAKWPLAGPIIKRCKRCGCGRTYNERQWNALPRRGIQRTDWGDVWELKNCPSPCGTTLWMQLVEGDPE